MALSAAALDELIKAELQEEWETVKQSWFPREDAEHSLYDKRTPGKFVYMLMHNVYYLTKYKNLTIAMLACSNT